MLMSADHVVEAVRRLYADRLQIRNHVVRSHAGVPGFEENRRAVGTFDEDGTTPSYVDVVDLELLRDCGENRETKDEHTENRPSQPHQYLRSLF